MKTTRLLTTAAATFGVAIGLAATAGAAPVSDDFWECAADHQDTDGLGVCCVFYGGDYDDRTGECWIDHEAKSEEADSGPGVPPKHPVLTRVDRLTAYGLMRRAPEKASTLVDIETSPRTRLFDTEAVPTDAPEALHCDPAIVV